MHVEKVYIKNNDLMCDYKDGDTVAKVNLGQVVPAFSVLSTTTGAAGTNANVVQGGTSTEPTLAFTIPRGNTGSTGPTGPEGPQGKQGISPTFTIEDGNLMADYDNPYVPPANG